MQDIGEGAARSISADGAIIVGDYEGVGAFRWTEATGRQDLNELYASLLTGGAYLEYIFAISPNGRYIVGQDRNPARGHLWEAFLLDTGAPSQEGDVNGDGCVDGSDLLAVLFAFGGSGGAEDLNGDRVVDDADLLLVLFNFSQGC